MSQHPEKPLPRTSKRGVPSFNLVPCHVLPKPCNLFFHSNLNEKMKRYNFYDLEREIPLKPVDQGW